MRFLTFALALGLVACGDPNGGSSAQPLSGAGASGGGGAGAGGSSTGTGGGAGSTSAPPGRVTTGQSPMPCDVASIVKLRCQSCHGAYPLSGVPMALMSWEDTQAPAVSNPSMSVAQMMQARVHDTVKPMPPTGLAPDSDVNVIDAWVQAGAPMGTDPSCAPPPPPPPPTDGGTGQYSGTIPDFADNCYELLSHGQPVPGDTTPFSVTGEMYVTYYFDAPWPDGAQAVSFEALYGDHPEVLHHWLVYLEENANEPDGQIVIPASFGTHPSSPTLIAGWAPGGENQYIPPDVGVQVTTPNRKVSLEFHYFYSGGTPVPTRAGAKVCTVEKPERLRPHTATVSWLGTELGIQLAPNSPGTAQGDCHPSVPQEINIVRSWPHMHLMGRGMETIIMRADGTQEPLNPPGGWPFDFNSEVSYPTPAVVHAGDYVRTICHYENTSSRFITVGYDNASEMCFNFTLAYPPKTLINPGLLGSSSLTNSATACLN